MLAAMLFFAGAAVAGAQTGPVTFPHQPSADDLIHALAGKPGASRGIVVRSSNPATGKESPVPAVALDVKFALNSAALSPDARSLIKTIAAAIKSDQLSQAHFLLEGHTDTTGTEPYNLRLSQLRAEAVRDELVKTYGVAPDRLKATGRGKEDLLDPAHPQSPANRRVVIANLGG